MNNDFAIFILSHGRADSILTVNTLKKCGYTGKWYIIIDNEDDQAAKYYENFGKDNVIMFDKASLDNTFDIMDNFTGRTVPTFARNVLHSIATDLKLTYFLELEDDYTEFRHRYVDKAGKLRSAYISEFDKIIPIYLEFLDQTGAYTVAFAQSGDLLGGCKSNVFKRKLTRKAMNCFFCRTDKPFKFIGRLNDDVNCYIENGKRGDLFFTTVDIVMNQPETQQRSGGITDTYKFFGTYVKSFYSVMLCPASVRISEMGESRRRIHHEITWENTVPKIINERYKK